MSKSNSKHTSAVWLLLLLCLFSNAFATDESDATTASSSSTTCPTIAFESPPEWIRYGGFLVLILASVCSLWAMAHVSEDYFCPALDVFCVRWKVPDSVAGSLVMAAGNDVPELAISFFGLFVQKNAVGIGTIIGSQLFNHMCIFAGSCWYAKGGVLHLNGRHLTRDSLGYFLSLIMLLWAVNAQPKNMLNPNAWTTTCLDVPFWRAGVLLICQVLYCLVVANFEKISDFLHITECATPIPVVDEDIELNVKTGNSSGDSPGGETTDNHGAADTHDSTSLKCTTSAGLPCAIHNSTKTKFIRTSHVNHWLVEAYEPCAEAWSTLIYPLKLLAEYTIPQPLNPEQQHLYALTLLVSTAWFSVYAFILCECLDQLGHLIRCPSVIMGLTFSAIGTSFPNLWSSLVVAQAGKGDMAVSNALGSNTFNIFLALGLPWFLYTAVYGDYRSIQDGGIADLTLILLILLIVVYIIMMMLGWKLYSWMAKYFFGVYLAVIVSVCVMMTTA